MRDDEDSPLGESEGRVGASRAEIEHTGREEGAEQVGFGVDQAFHDAFVGESLPMVLGADGMPTEADAPGRSDLAPLSPETLVCMEDRRQWVEVFLGESGYVDETRTLVSLRLFGSQAFRETLSGSEARERYGDTGEERERRRFQPAATTVRFGVRWGTGLEGRLLCPVRPVRPRCAHYERFVSQATELEVNGRSAQPMQRFCGAFRSVGGAKMSLTDEAMLACEARTPPDPASLAMLDARDEQKIEQGKKRVHVPLLDRGPERDFRAEARAAREREKERGGLLDVVLPVDRALVEGPSVLRPKLRLVVGPQVDLTFHDVAVLVLVERGYQPPDHAFLGVTPEGGKAWGASDSGQILARVPVDEPSFDREEDYVHWPAFASPLLPLQITKNAQGCAAALRAGKSVVVGGATLGGAVAFFAACAWRDLTGEPGSVAYDHMLEKTGGEKNPVYAAYLKREDEKR